MTTPSPIEPRVARIEQTLAELSAELAAIRAELRTSSTTTPTNADTRPASPAGFASRRGRRRLAPSRRISTQELEHLLGSYGMLAIAVLAAVAAVGTFLSWAVGHGYLTLTPPFRVAIGVAFAALIGLWGMRLRRTERSFGSSMLGLALVIIHVCAYAAGPTFALIPTWMAFAGAAAASWALVLFAHGEDDEPLWCVGFGGAAIAPFVTSNGQGSLSALLVYGSFVLLLASFAISRRSWPIAWRVFYLASALFTLSSAWRARSEGTALVVAAFAFPFVIAAAGVVPFAAPSRKRGALRWLCGLAAVGSALMLPPLATSAWLVAGAVFAGACVALFFTDRHWDVEQSSILARGRSHLVLLDWIDVAVIPIALVIRSADAITAVASSASVYGAAVVAFVLFAWRRPVSHQRDAAAFAATALAMAAVGLLPLETPIGQTAAFAAIGLAAIWLHVARPSHGWLATGAFALIIAATVTAGALLHRRAYQISPFLTEPSGAALIVTAALAAVARFWRTLRNATRAAFGQYDRSVDGGLLRLILRTALLAPWVWAFVWGLIELAMAFSPSASMLLLVTYFAATAVACVAVGRMRRSARLRQTGLALALAAAGTALNGAHAYFDFGARIAAYLVTSAFLLGIAYWYRRPGASARPA